MADQPATTPNASGRSSKELDQLAGMAGAESPLDTGPEKDLWSGRTHWMHHAGRFSFWLVLTIAACVGAVALNKSMQLGFAGMALAVVLAALFLLLVVCGKPILEIMGTHYRLTTQRLFIERGILSKTVDQTELLRVDDVRLHKTVIDRVFGLGSVAIVSTDATDREILISGIREADKVAEGIRVRMRRLRNKTLFVEQL